MLASKGSVGLRLRAIANRLLQAETTKTRYQQSHALYRFPKQLEKLVFGHQNCLKELSVEKGAQLGGGFELGNRIQLLQSARKCIR